MDRDTLRALDAVEPTKNQATLDCVLGMGGSRDRKRKLKVLEDRLPDAGPGGLQHRASSKVPQGTKGLTLAAMRAVVCMDYVGNLCYVDIQAWQDSGKRTVELDPSGLHESLREWVPYWTTGGGQMSHSAAARFRREVLELERVRREDRSIMAEIFGAEPM